MAEHIVRAKSYLNIDEEKVAAETITPGMLIELNSDDKFQKHASAGGTVFPCFADRDKWQGNTVTDDYSADDQLIGWYPTTGDEVENAILDGASPDVSIGDPLESNGDGKLRKHDVASSAGVITYDKQIVGFAKEAVSPGGSDTRFRFQVA